MTLGRLPAFVVPIRSFLESDFGRVKGISVSPGKAIGINPVPLLIALSACVALFLLPLYNLCKERDAAVKKYVQKSSSYSK
jgi:hypothetical protein